MILTLFVRLVAFQRRKLFHDRSCARSEPSMERKGQRLLGADVTQFNRQQEKVEVFRGIFQLHPAVV